MLYQPSGVNTTDFINGSATSTTTGVVSIPANRYFSVDIMLSGSQSGVGTATPHVTWTSSGGTFSPSTGSVVAQLSVTGALSVVGSTSCTTEFSGYSGSNGATLDFNVGGGTASCVINGFLF